MVNKNVGFPGHRGFQPMYTEQQFLAVMPDDGTPIAQGTIMRRMGCFDSVLRRCLPKLVEQGKIQRVEIVGCRDIVWQKVV